MSQRENNLRAEKNTRPAIGLQHNESIPHPEAGFNWLLNKHVY